MTDDLPELHVGDHVRDREDVATRLVVVNLPTGTAEEFRLGPETVADVNEAYPAHDRVVEAVYPGRDDEQLADLKRFAFPRSRLERVAAIHSTEEATP